MGNQDFLNGVPEKKTFFQRLTPLTKGLMLFLVLGIIGVAIYYVAPGLRTDDAVHGEQIIVDGKIIDNVSYAEMLPLPTDRVSTVVKKVPPVTIAGYAWNAQTGIYTANGREFTTKGSLMEERGINLRLVRQDWLSELRAMQMKFIEQYDAGEEYPSSDKAAVAIMIMGDGVPFYISTMNQALEEKFNGKYHVVAVGSIGVSYGEDKLIGRPEWKTNPKSMLGTLISVVPGDGDWVVLVNYCFANKLPVNPNFNTYDANAVNIYPSENDDYMKSAEELIKAQTTNWTIPLKEVVNGKLTGKTIDKKIDGCATWTPGDAAVFDALTGFTDITSTADFPNQMATTIVIVKEWAEAHPKFVQDVLAATYTANNQIKQHEEWSVRGSEAIATGFNLKTPKYWYDMRKGVTATKAGIEYSMGGSRVFTYADAMQYYGITDGVNRYEAVYNQVSTYLTTLNPFDFNSAVKRVTPYDEAVNLTYLRNATVESVGTVEEKDYTETKTSMLASGEWYINFNTGSDEIMKSSDDELESLYNLLVQAEQTKITVVGHTDDTGSDQVNNPLSESRAQSVVSYLLRRGINRNRIQEVRGAGSSEPLVANTNATNRGKNRRVQITLFQ